MTNFLQRNNDWVNKKRSSIQKAKNINEKNLEKELIFRPKINREKITQILEQK